MEKMHDTIDGQARVLLTHIQHLTGKIVFPEDRLFAWAARHVGWIVGRCVVRQDGTTPYMAITGTPDRAQLCIFGETVRYLHSKFPSMARLRTGGSSECGPASATPTTPTSSSLPA
eukprot:8470070-Alexandrium_andersonii.AAC.1